ncbi:MAG: UDP-N-acetylmuramate--L-alanine ligase [Lachnospiraceae bacterium]|nr:UDP-N-acetylmuramate--L-alanine ligase [Lachnospiraceae bacterium]
MYQIDFKNPGKIHFIGIGGISMSGFAELLSTMGFTVSGSDMKQSKITNHLETLGIQIYYGHNAKNITDDLSLVVYTAAIHPDNPEYAAAQALHLPLLERAVMVGQVMKNYQNAIAISGTHGKTTTTSMISHIFLAAQKDPTISVGGILDVINGNIRVGKSENFITEACEYTNSFLHFFPTTSVILNIEEDHLDFFKDINDIRNSFNRFANLLPENGNLIINTDIENYQDITDGIKAKVITYGICDETADFYAKNISYDENGCGNFTLVRYGKETEKYQLHVSGRHNISNCLAALAVADCYDISAKQVQMGLSGFRGTERRFEYKGEKNGFTIIDDYAHHPTEIKATLSSAAVYPHQKLWVAFQPHTYTRTRAFLTDFADALTGADAVILADIYAAREQDPGDISSEDLKKELEKRGTEVYYFKSFDEIEKFILKNLVHGDLLITMGAGNIVDIGESLLNN